MPISVDELDDTRRRLNFMIEDTIRTVGELRDNLDLFPEYEELLAAAIDEWRQDFYSAANEANEVHPEAAIYRAEPARLQRAGLYGSQLTLKERLVTNSNGNLREALVQRPPGIRRVFRKWVGVVNNFLGSFKDATGWGQALKEIKDCLMGSSPDID